MDDWFFSMDETERVQFLKEHMRERRYYDGAIDGNTDAAYFSAQKAYRKALNLPEAGPVDLVFFKLFITAAVPRGPLAGTPRKVVVANATAPAGPAASEPTPVVEKSSAVSAQSSLETTCWALCCACPCPSRSTVCSSTPLQNSPSWVEAWCSSAIAANSTLSCYQ